MQELLHLVVDAVKDAQESFEKPTAQLFYLKIMAKSNSFSGLNFLVLKNKMRYLKTGFISAMEWKKSTGAGLTADMGERSVTEHVLKICPKFD
ncbi:uncharacterized protein LOC119673111 isoform X2 [Teleopsis dalmanni]|uniref:uncharacterized protein LOC119673111 isoform X2 n=1 Tax=Teleopsis dalmanni TaxID=139649 RepID=UPI0018CF71C3|nr:uncharacterized protein LOC119673111 isoform X2 [Teleopsis dalmanni]